MKRLLVIPLSLGLLWTAACGPDDEPAETPTEDVSTDLTNDVTVDVTVDADVAGPDVPAVELSLAFHFVIEGGTKGEGEDSATLYPEDEPLGYAGIPSLQVDIAAAASGLTTGRPVELIVNGNKMGEVQAFADEGLQSALNFTAITMPPSGNEGYTVTVQSTTTEGTAISASKTVFVHTDQCPVFVNPTTEQGCLVQDSDPEAPGLQVAVQVMHSGGTCNRGRLTYSVDDGEAVVLEDVLFDESGFANFTIPVTTEEGPFEGTLSLTAEAIHPSSPTLNGSLSGLVYNVDTDVPSVTITQPDLNFFDTINLTMDKDPSTDAIGIQYDVIGSVTGLSDLDFQSLALTVDGVPAGLATPQSGVFAFQDVTFTQNGSVTIAVTGTDTCSNVGTAEVDIDVFSGLSELTINSPATSTTLLSKDNGLGGTENVYSTSFNLTASDLLAGNKLLVECRALNGGNTYFEVGSMTMAAENIAEDNSYDLPVLLDTAVISNSSLCRARVEAENPNQSADIALTIGLPAPGISLSTPSDGVKLNELAITLVGEASNLEGQPLDITVSSLEMEDCVFQDGNVAGGVYSFTSDLAANCPAMTSGSYTITIGASDGYGNTTADNGGDAQVLALFDVTAPTLALTTPAMEAVLDPVNNGDLDTDPKPGYQTTFSAQMTGETDTVGAQLCLAVAGEDQGCQNVDAGFAVTWSSVTLQPGESSVVLSGHDAYGNPGASVETSVTLDYDAPVVKIITPAVDVVTTASELDFVVEVSDSDTLGLIGDATVALLRDGTDVGGAPTIDVVAGTYTFAGIEILPAGPAVPFQATADYQGLQGASGERMVTKKTTFPTIAVTNVSNGQFFNLASDECAGTQQDCVLNVDAVLTDAEPGSLAELDVTCTGGGDPSNYPYEITDLTAAFEGVALTHGGDCTLIATITDLAGQKVAGAEIVVSVDRLAPVAIIQKPTGETLLSYDDVHPSEGLQSPLQVSVSGLSVNNIVTAQMDWTDTDGAAQQKVYQHVMTQDVADDDVVTVAFSDEGFDGMVTYPDGSVLLTIATADAALNPTSVAKSVLVQSNPPSVLIQLPFDLGDDACADHADCGPGAVCNEGVCWTALGSLSASSITVFATGFITTEDNLRLCSDNAEMVAAGGAVPCATEGYVQAEMLSIAAGGSLPISITGLADGYHTLVVELQDQVGAAWTKSVEADSDFNHKRRIYRDTVSPSVLSLSSSSDTLPPLGGASPVLNKAEQVQDGGYYNLDFIIDETGTYEVIVNDTVRGTGSMTASDPVTAMIQLDEGGNQVHIKAADLAGNLSPLPPNALVVYYTPNVDTVDPSLAFVNPEEGQGVVLADDSLNITLSSDKNGGTVTLFDNLQPVGTVQVTNNLAIFVHDPDSPILSDGAHSLTAQVVGPSGNTNSAGPVDVTVDATPPTVSIESPSSGESITDDASAATPGFQLAVDFSTGGDAATWAIVVVSGCADDYTGCQAGVEVSSGAVTNPDGPEPQQLVTVPISEALSYKQVWLEVSDAAGNQVTTSANVNFDIGSCSVAFTDLPEGNWFNADSCAAAGGCATASVTLNATFFACGDVDDIQLEGATVDAQSQDLANGAASFDITLTDGVPADLELKVLVDSAEAGSSGIQSRGVDLTLPDVALTAVDVATLDGGSFSTPSEGEVTTYGAADDGADNGGFQAYIAVMMTDTNATDGQILSVTTDTGSGPTSLNPSDPALPASFDGDSGSYVVLKNVTLTDLASNVVVVTARDAAGNQDSATFTVDVDTQAPDAVLLTNTTGGVIDSDDVDPRLPSVALKFTAVGDDGNSGTAASYGVRYSRSPIVDTDDWDNACDVSALAHTVSLPSPSAAGDSESLMVAGPDPSDPEALTNGQYCRFEALDTGTYYFAVRAQDDAGNWSDLAASSTASTDEIVWRMDRIVISAEFEGVAGVNPDRLTRNVAIVGDVDNDGAADVLFGYKDRGFCLVRGGSLGDLYTISDLTGPSHECVVDPDIAAGGVGGDDIGTYFTALGDVNGDGLDDFAVTSKLDGLGVVSIYLGVQDTGPDLTAANVRVTGLVVTSTFYGVGAAGNFNGDVHSVTGNDLDDIIVGEESASRARIIAGNESWTAATSLTIDTENAADLDTHVLLNVTSDPTTLPKFGGRMGSAGDVLPTPDGGIACDDLLIRQSSGSDTGIHVIAGRVITTMNETVNVTKDTENPTSEDLISTVLRQDFTSAGTLTSYGPNLQGGHDLTGDGVPDVVVTHGATKSSYIGVVDGADGRSVFVFDGAAIAAAAGGTLRVEGGATAAGDSYAGGGGYVLYEDPNNYYGGTRIIGDWDGWLHADMPTPDLAVGQEGAKQLVLRMNHVLDSASIGQGSYPWADQTLSNPFTPDDSNAFGRTVDGGADVTGDGLIDIVVGTGLQEFYIIR